jgi:hypothetical protein
MSREFGGCTGGWRTLDSVPLLLFLADVFINTFGITQPTEATRRRAAWFIFAMLVLTLVLLTAFCIALYNFLHR